MQLLKRSPSADVRYFALKVPAAGSTSLAPLQPSTSRSIWAMLSLPPSTAFDAAAPPIPLDALTNDTSIPGRAATLLRTLRHSAGRLASVHTSCLTFLCGSRPRDPHA